MRLQRREPFPDVNLRSRSLAAEIYEAHDPRTLDPGDYDGRRYLVAGRLLARRKHRHATFFDLRDQSGVIELCVRRDRVDRTQCAQLLSADIGDIVAAEGTVYVTDNHGLALSVLSSQLLTKALRAPPACAAGAVAMKTKRRQLELGLLAGEQTRLLLEKRSAAMSAIRAWMALNSFVEVEGPANRLFLRRCMLSGLERVYGSRKELEWLAGYIDYTQAAHQAEELVLRVAAAVVPEMNVRAHKTAIDMNGPWPNVTVRESILELCGIDILASDCSALARHLPGCPAAGARSWGSLVTELYVTTVEPRLVQPTIVYDFPLAGRALTKRHRIDDRLASSFDVVVGGMSVVTGGSELNDPLEQAARLLEQQEGVPNARSATPAGLEEDVRLLEYGLCPAAGARLEVDRLLALLTGSEVIPLPLPMSIG